MQNTCNGHTHFVKALPANVDHRQPKKRRGWFGAFLLCLIVTQFVCTFAASIGLLFYMGRQQNEVERKMKDYNDMVNSELGRLNTEIENAKKKLNFEIENAKKGFKLSAPLQLKESGSTKHIAVTVESSDDFPEMESINEDELISPNEDDPQGEYEGDNYADEPDEESDKVESVPDNRRAPFKITSANQSVLSVSNDSAILMKINPIRLLSQTPIHDGPRLVDEDLPTTKITPNRTRNKRSAGILSGGMSNAIVENTSITNPRPSSVEAAATKCAPCVNRTDSRSNFQNPNEEPKSPEYNGTGSSPGNTIKTKRERIPIKTDSEINHRYQGSIKSYHSRSENSRQIKNKIKSFVDIPPDVETITEYNNGVSVTEVKDTLVAAHFEGDTSSYSMKTHEYYKGNGHLHHPTGEYKDWKPSEWFERLQMDEHIDFEKGNIKIQKEGLYFVYAQIYYYETSDVNGYAILKNSDIVLRCVTSAFTQVNDHKTFKSNTCYTGGVIHCKRGDTIAIKNNEQKRRVVIESSKSFVGMFMLGNS